VRHEARGRNDETSQQPTHLHRYRCGYRYRYSQDEGNAGKGGQLEESRGGGKRQRTGNRVPSDKQTHCPSLALGSSNNHSANNGSNISTSATSAQHSSSSNSKR